MKLPMASQVSSVSLQVFLTLVFSVLSYSFLFAWPFIAYRLKSPSAAKECGSIRVGMTLQVVRHSSQSNSSKGSYVRGPTRSFLARRWQLFCAT